MTILSAQSIRARHIEMLHADGRPMIDPFSERGVFQGKSYGLSSCGYDVRLDQMIEMKEGFILASTMERIRIPIDLVAHVRDKSSWARQGLTVASTVLEPGWYGFVTLELTLHPCPALGPRYLRLPAGTPIAQIQFTKLDWPTEQPYPAGGKYQNQERGPVPARDEETPEPEGQGDGW